LFYRLSVFETHVPPLRDRLEDILPLAERFAERYATGTAQLSSAVALLLPLYSWPGNVRELQNAVERATLMARGGMVLPEHLPRRIRDAAGQETAEADADSGAGRMEQMERMLILRTLRENQYNRTDTARALGISRRALTYKLQRLRDLGFPVDSPSASA
jgi:transcriptional regulator with PAS, ATPase and Fis domain